MMVGGIARFPPPPDGSERPVMWKSLGIIAQDARGYVEAHYELKTFRGDLDPDSEDEVRASTHGLLAALTSTNRPIDGTAIYTLQRRSGLLKVRLAAAYWNEPTTMTGRM